VFICTFVLFRKQLKLLLGFFYCARPIKSCDEIIGHLVNLKLNAHFHPFLILHFKFFKGIMLLATCPPGMDLARLRIDGKHRRGES